MRSKRNWVFSQQSISFELETLSNFMGQLTVGINILISLCFSLKLADCIFFYTLFQLFFFCYSQCCYSYWLATNVLFNPQLFIHNVFQLKPWVQLYSPYPSYMIVPSQVKNEGKSSCHMGKSRYVPSKTESGIMELELGLTEYSRSFYKNCSPCAPKKC